MLDFSLQGFLKSQTSPSVFLGEGNMWTRGRSWCGRSGEQLTVSYFLLGKKRLWTAPTLMEKGVSSRSKDCPGERLGCKKKATEWRSSPTFKSVGIPRHHLKVLENQLCPKGKSEKSKASAIQQICTLVTMSPDSEVR